MIATSSQAVLVWDFEEPTNNPSNGYVLSDLIGTDGLLVGDKLFADFSYTNVNNIGVIFPDASSIAVTPVIVGDSFGLRFNGPWLANPGEALDSTVRFSVEATDPDLYISEAQLFVTASSVALDGSVSISENLFDGAPPTSNEIGDLSYFETDDDIFASNTTEFDPIKKVWVVKNIALEGQAFGFAHLSEFYQVFVQVPEPSSAILVGLGAITILRRRRA